MLVFDLFETIGLVGFDKRETELYCLILNSCHKEQVGGRWHMVLFVVLECCLVGCKMVL